MVISLDFELAWGLRDLYGAGAPYWENVRGAREAVPRLLDLFNEFDVAATWATVGFLFAESREELIAHWPEERPGYRDTRLDPYLEELGNDERDDPLHYAPSLVREIASRPRQEIGSHTFSHYYCLEAGQTAAQFEADLAAARRIAAARGHEVTSLVFPRNQYRPDYLPALIRNKFNAFRGNEPNHLNRPRPGASGAPPLRAVRLADVYLNLTGAAWVPWDDVARGDGLVDVRASRFLRPWSRHAALEALRWRRVAEAMSQAAEAGGLFHLWWHPHNFGVDLDQNLSALRRHLELYERLKEQHGFGSYSMGDVARLAT